MRAGQALIARVIPRSRYWVAVWGGCWVVAILVVIWWGGVGGGCGGGCVVGGEELEGFVIKGFVGSCFSLDVCVD